MLVEARCTVVTRRAVSPDYTPVSVEWVLPASEDRQPLEGMARNLNDSAPFQPLKTATGPAQEGHIDCIVDAVQSINLTAIS
jgi:hypothetical protein